MHSAPYLSRAVSHGLLPVAVTCCPDHTTTCQRGYYFGNRIIAEVDIVLPEDMMLKEAHDIGESLQIAIEGLEFVERAFVHLDYEWFHAPEHKIFGI